MIGNKNRARRKVEKAPGNHPNSMRSIHLVGQILQSMLLTLEERIKQAERRNYLHCTLLKVAYSDHLINVEDFFHRGLAFTPSQACFQTDQEPKSIPFDNLCRTPLDKSDQKSIQSFATKSRVSTLSKSDSKLITSKLNVKQRSVKLELQTIEETREVRQFRQSKVEQEIEKAKKAQEEQQEIIRRSKRKAKLQQNIGFDYNGHLLPRISSDRDNLVEKVLRLKLKKQKLSKRNPLPPPAEPVGEVTKKGYKKKDRTVKEQSQFLEFLDCQSLTDSVEITRGIRYQHNSLVFQEKKKTLSIPDLRMGLGKRKMSKHEFARIQDFFERKRQDSYKKMKTMKTEHLLQRNLSEKRAFSQGNFLDSRIRQPEKINVLNPELRKSMLIRLEDYQPYLVLEKEFPLNDDYNQSKDRDQPRQTESKVQETNLKRTQASPNTPKLPPLSRKSTPHKLDRESMVLTSLRQQFFSKLQV